MRAARFSFLTLTAFTLLIAELAPAFADGPLKHWSYRAVIRPDVPETNPSESHPIDAFLVRELDKIRLGFSPPALPHEIVRRVKFDLVGLPPTSEEVDAFAADHSAAAYERMVESFLSSPQYGERWGRHWLDVVRYADSAGFNADPVRPLAYKYRDYVIQSLNDDVPYDRFLTEQLAGDEVAADRDAGWIAAGFLRLGPDESNASNILLARQELLNELTAAVATIFLGQTLGCAQCHDHKFDPLTKLDFYRLQAYFAGIIPLDRAPVGTALQLTDYAGRHAEFERNIAPLVDELLHLEQPARIQAAGDRRMKFPDVVLAAIDAPGSRRTAMQHQLAFFCERQIPITDEQLRQHLDETQKKRRDELLAELSAKRKNAPEPPRWIEVMTATDGDPLPPTHDLAGGSYAILLEEVQPGVPDVLNYSAESFGISPPRPGTSGRRTALARWLIDPRNPLTARVMVNRVWQGHFGRGLVPNANDFGTQSPAPTHPELLDWLAAEFVDPSYNIGGELGLKPWSLKRLHKLIMLSSAYRQAADRAAAAANQTESLARSVDPTNQWYWCFPSRRLEAEAIRDACLAVSGRLNAAMFGPGVQPELPSGYTRREAWKTSPELSARQRRSIYILSKRNLPYPWLNDFDLPDAHESCARRLQTTTAPQALAMLNSEIVLDEARAFAGRLLRDHPRGEAADIVPAAYRLALSRFPTVDEQADAAKFLVEQETMLSESRTFDGLLPLGGFPKFLPPTRAAAIIDLCHAILNCNEFIYLD